MKGLAVNMASCAPCHGPFAMKMFSKYESKMNVQWNYQQPCCVTDALLKNCVLNSVWKFLETGFMFDKLTGVI
jgi:hypothetical protein